MTIKKRGLGRGLDALLGDVSVSVPKNQIHSLPIEYLQRGRFQPRKDIDPERLQELADSISAQGVVQPIVVRLIGDDKYEIIAGERRWRAAQLAGLQEIPVVQRDVSDQAAMAMALIENIQREDLSPLEEAEALQRLLKEFQMTHQQAADAVGKSRATVTNLLRLLELHPDVKALLAKGSLEMGHARALLGLDLDRQLSAAHRIVAHGMTVRAAEKLVKDLQENKPKPVGRVFRDPDVLRLQDDISNRLGAKVQIRHGKNGKGQMVINYTSLEELEGVLDKIR